MTPKKLIISILTLFLIINNISAAIADANCPTPIAASENAINEIRLKNIINRNPFIQKDLDCRYLNPPQHLTIIGKTDSVTECQMNKSALVAMKSGCPYYVSEYFNENGPIWCIQKSAASAGAIDTYEFITKATCNE
jgi:hypothetical protein